MIIATLASILLLIIASVADGVVEGDYYILHVNSYSFDVSPTGMTATIRFVK